MRCPGKGLLFMLVLVAALYVCKDAQLAAVSKVPWLAVQGSFGIRLLLEVLLPNGLKCTLVR